LERSVPNGEDTLIEECSKNPLEFDWDVAKLGNEREWGQENKDSEYDVVLNSPLIVAVALISLIYTLCTGALGRHLLAMETNKDVLNELCCLVMLSVNTMVGNSALNSSRDGTGRVK
jgi:hypothetical protein